MTDQAQTTETLSKREAEVAAAYADGDSYKVIARDTIEEKVLELQTAKQDLAEAVFCGDSSDTIRGLTKDDFAFLLG